jgi:hypothetical protein
MLPAVGVNEMLKFALCPGARVHGSAAWLTAHPVPLAEICWTVTLAAPVFVSAASWVTLLPAAAVPKLMLDGLTLNTPVLAPVPCSDT